jgi:hypothetical protein
MMIEKRVQKLRARLGHWQARVDRLNGVPRKTQERAQCRWQLRKAEALLEAAEKEAEEMRRHDEIVVETVATWPWRVWSGQLRLGDRVYNRGEIVPDEIVTNSLNGARLVQSGAVRRLPAPPVKAAPPTPPRPAASVANAPVPSIIDRYAAEVRRIAAERGIGLIEAEDLLPDRDLQTRALRALAEEKRPVLAGAWGSPASLTPNGSGTSRRIPDHDELRRRVREYQPSSPAA